MIVRIIVCLIMLLVAHNIIAQQQPVEDFVSERADRKVHHYVGLQANQLIRQPLSFGGTASHRCSRADEQAEIVRLHITRRDIFDREALVLDKVVVNVLIVHDQILPIERTRIILHVISLVDTFPARLHQELI